MAQRCYGRLAAKTTEKPPKASAKQPTIETRRVAILVTDGFDRPAYDGIVAALQSAKAVPYTIGTRRTPIYAEGESKESGKGVKPDHQYGGDA